MRTRYIQPIPTYGDNVMNRNWLVAITAVCCMFGASARAEDTPEASSAYLTAIQYQRIVKKDDAQYAVSLIYIFDKEVVRRMDVTIKVLMPAQPTLRAEIYIDAKDKSWTLLSYVPDVRDTQPCKGEWLVRIPPREPPTLVVPRVCPDYRPVTMSEVNIALTALYNEMLSATQREYSDGAVTLIPRASIKLIQ
ncbi:MAG: hypothetical protein AAB901_02605 [Patescibacteria group bacterium]